MALLELDSATRRYGALRVVDDLSLHVNEGEVLGIVGPNGAGKTTALSIIAGDVALSDGHVRWRGRDITRLPAHRRCHLGIGRTFQVPKPFLRMTVYENVLVGALQGHGTRRTSGDAAFDALERTGLAGRANMPASSLTLLELKRLELARAVATRPALLLLDESAGGLMEHEVQQLLPTIRQLRADGAAVIWIEHVLHALLAVADRVVCIARGRKLAEGAPSEVMASSAVQEAYLGAMVA